MRIKELRFFWRCSLLLGGCNAAVSFYIAKLEQLKCKRLFVGAFANTYYTVKGLGDVTSVVVKKSIYVSFVQNLLWFFFGKRNTFCTNWEFRFWQTSIVLVNKFSKIENISSGKNDKDWVQHWRWRHMLLFQTIRFIYVFSFNQIWKCGLVVKNFGSRDVLADKYCRPCCRFKAFNHYTTVIVLFFNFLNFLSFIRSLFDWQLCPN